MTPSLSSILYKQLFKGEISDPVPSMSCLAREAAENKADAAALAPTLDQAKASLAMQVDAAPSSQSNGSQGNMEDDLCLRKSRPLQPKPELEKMGLRAEWQRIHQSYAGRHTVVFPRHILLLIVHETLKSGVSAEVMEKVRQEAQQNLDRSRARYMKRTRQPDPSPAPVPGQAADDAQSSPPDSDGDDMNTK